MARARDTGAKQRRSRWAESIGLKIQALLWVLAAGLTVYFTDFVHTCFFDSRVNRAYFNVALATFAASSTIVLYLAVYLPYVRRIDTDWLEYCPNVVYTATGFGVLSALTFLFALWPVWGLLTPAIQAVLFLGALMTSHFLPAC